MKLLIDIPEHIYEHAKEGSEDSRDEGEAMRAIANGSPLPKGHGRLIDEKDLSLMTVHMIDGIFVCDAPTIIEADKEVEE